MTRKLHTQFTNISLEVLVFTACGPKDAHLTVVLNAGERIIFEGNIDPHVDDSRARDLRIDRWHL